AHGDSQGVHASDAVNAWRNVARVSNQRNRVASLVLAARFAAGQRGGGDFTERSFPLPEDLEPVRSRQPDALLRELDAAIRQNHQRRACAIVHRYGELDHPPRAVLDQLLRYAISEDGRLHGEKYYRTVAEEYAMMRPAFRGRQLVALARVTASGYGYDIDDNRSGRAPGYDEARRLLGLA
ncbi:MAG: hypothetical protein ACREIV_03695, partial [Planctomycetaceae bacterium]